MNAICTNSFGSFSCSCMDGFQGNGTECNSMSLCFCVDAKCNGDIDTIMI